MAENLKPKKYSLKYLAGLGFVVVASLISVTTYRILEHYSPNIAEQKMRNIARQVREEKSQPKRVDNDIGLRIEKIEEASKNIGKNIKDFTEYLKDFGGNK